MNYIVSQWGEGVSVGLAGDPSEVDENANLAHNLFKSRFYNDLFNGRINFSSLRQFYKFVVYKHCLAYMSENNCSLREAIVNTKKEIRGEFIMKKNFMGQLRNTPVTYRQGSYNDGDFGYDYED